MKGHVVNGKFIYSMFYETELENYSVTFDTMVYKFYDKDGYEKIFVSDNELQEYLIKEMNIDIEEFEKISTKDLLHAFTNTYSIYKDGLRTDVINKK